MYPISEIGKTFSENRIWYQIWSSTTQHHTIITYLGPQLNINENNHKIAKLNTLLD